MVTNFSDAFGLAHAKICNQANTAQIPSFSRTWFEPVPKDSSPQINGVKLVPPYNSSLSMRLPKNFQPVGVSKRLKFKSFATRSTAPDVGMDRATPLKPPWVLKNGMLSALATMTAKESDGLTKNCFPRIMLRSPSPSAAAPNSGTTRSPTSIFSPLRLRPIISTSSCAYVRFGSACPPLKSFFGTAFMQTFSGCPRMSMNIIFEYGPLTPCIVSYTIVKSSRSSNALMEAKSKILFNNATWASVESMISILASVLPSAALTVTFPVVAISTTGKSWQILYDLMMVVLR